MAHIAKNIRLLRTAQNMTQDQLAEALHVTRQTVSNYETGKSQPDIDTIVRLAEALQADPNTLIYGIPTPPERKREYVKTAVAAAAAVLAVVILQQEGPLGVWVRKDFRGYLLYTYLIFAKPLSWFALGGAAMQVLSLCFGLRPCVQKAVKCCIVTVSTIWLLLTFSASANFLWMDWVQQSLVHSEEAYGGWCIYDVPVIGKMVNWMISPGIPVFFFLFFGAAWWLFRTKKA